MQTNVGIERALNEDTAHVDPRGRFVVLADGMGGPGFGEVASAIAVEQVRLALESYADAIAAFEAQPSPTGREAIRAAIDQAVRRAHDAVVERGRAESDKHGMGSTLDVVVVTGGEAFVAHVGDSRTYLIRDGRARQVTADHTVAATLARAGALTAEEAETSPLRTVLASAIGLPKMFAVDHGHFELRIGDRLLISSDGLHSHFTADHLARRLASAELDAALLGLIDDARARGGRDNMTGIVLAVHPAEMGSDVGPLRDGDTAIAQAESWPLSPEDLSGRKS